jgi:excinuclease UvrABC nuclease subunit
LEINCRINPVYRVVQRIHLDILNNWSDSGKAHEILQLLEWLFLLSKCKGNLEKPWFYYYLNQGLGITVKILKRK